jgi:hypothetical protein
VLLFVAVSWWLGVYKGVTVTLQLFPLGEGGASKEPVGGGWGGGGELSGEGEGGRSGKAGEGWGRLEEGT